MVGVGDDSLQRMMRAKPRASLRVADVVIGPPRHGLGYLGTESTSQVTALSWSSLRGKAHQPERRRVTHVCMRFDLISYDLLFYDGLAPLIAVMRGTCPNHQSGRYPTRKEQGTRQSWCKRRARGQSQEIKESRLVQNRCFLLRLCCLWSNWVLLPAGTGSG